MLFLHLFSSLASDILLLATATASLFYLRQNYCLKTQKKIISLPSIQALDNWILRLLISAFALMSLGIVAGSILAYQQWGRYWYLDPRQIWSVVNWFVFAVVLLTRFLVGWRGPRAVWVTLSGVTLMMLGFLMLHYFSWSQHHGF